MRMTPEDRAWRRAMRHYIRNEDAQVPPAGRFNFGQKQLFWLMVIGGLALLLSGIVLWFVASIPWELRGLRYAAVLVHAVAALVTIGGFIIHLYMGLAVVPGGFRRSCTATSPRSGRGTITRYGWRRSVPRVTQERTLRGRQIPEDHPDAAASHRIMPERVSSDARWDQRIARARTLAAEHPAAHHALTFYAAVAAYQKSLAIGSEAAGMVDVDPVLAAIPDFLNWLSREAPAPLVAAAREMSRSDLFDGCPFLEMSPKEDEPARKKI